MAEFPAFPLWTDAYLADTGHLTTLEHGVYLLLLMTMWRAGGSLPNDDKKLARFCRLTPSQWRRVKPTMMEFFRIGDGVITQGRLSDELSFVKRKSKSQSQNSRARWLKTNDTGDAMGSSRHSHGNPPTPTPTPEVKKEAKASQKKPTRIPPEWHVSPALLSWCFDHGMSEEEVCLEADQFRDHWRAAVKNSTSPAWDLKFHTWCRNAIKWKPARKGNGDGRLNGIIEMATSLDGSPAPNGGVDSGSSADASQPLLHARLIGGS